MDMKTVLVAVCLLLVSPITGHWWAVGSHVVMDPTLVCKKTRRLRGRLADICKKEPALLKEISKGVAQGSKECQYQFRNRRWNCTNVRRSLKKVLMRDTRETAFVNAITAAGVVYAVTRACTMGDLVECSCDKNVKGREEPHAHGVQVPRAVGLVHPADLLAQDAALPGRGQPPEGALRRRGQGDPGQRRPPLPDGGPHHQAARPRRPGVPGGLARLLPAEPQHGLAGHRGPPLQRHLARRRGLRPAVLRPRLRHAARRRARQLPVPLPLVLRGHVQHVPGAARDQHVPLSAPPPPPPRTSCHSAFQARPT
ncbi:uncharacterized protein LOC134538733 isoform X2 [Bacillus rossius redtenbacheri]|uniref:uncharacterized protein LOC134538733 isoform X2 n=1 Tax=Bacillus rossius redtenbacheri TaxID=93214 RepID=UPI002FDEA7F3